MADADFRNTLYIWDGIMTFEEKREADGSDKDVPCLSYNLQWGGTWVGVKESPDAKKVNAPKRGAFEEFVTSEMSFDVRGSASKSKKEDEYYVATMVEGAGYDVKKEGKDMEKCHDKAHELLLKNVRWLGNMKDQRENVVFGRGENESGHFISAGWMRPGNRVSLARRFLPENDERIKWTIQDLRETIFDEICTIKSDNGVTIRTVVIPPWQCDALHAEYQPRGEKRKHEESAADEDTSNKKKSEEDVAAGTEEAKD